MMTMPRMTLIYAVLLLILGLGGFFITGRQSFTALIPAFYGVIVLIVAIFAIAEMRRRLMMHIAAALGLIGFLATMDGLWSLVGMLNHTETARPAATISKAIMALLSVIFFAVCLGSFIGARRKASERQ